MQKLLNEHNAEFKLLDHQPTKTSQESADVRGVTLASGAKAMLLKNNSSKMKANEFVFYLAVLSASRKFNWKLLKKLVGVKNIRFATPEEVWEQTRCLSGAVPPFGSVFGMPTVVDKSIIE